MLACDDEKTLISTADPAQILHVPAPDSTGLQNAAGRNGLVEVAGGDLVGFGCWYTYRSYI